MKIDDISALSDVTTIAPLKELRLDGPLTPYEEKCLLEINAILENGLAFTDILCLGQYTEQQRSDMFGLIQKRATEICNSGLGNEEMKERFIQLSPVYKFFQLGSMRSSNT
jgi:hypothetical protein